LFDHPPRDKLREKKPPFEVDSYYAVERFFRRFEHVFAARRSNAGAIAKDVKRAKFAFDALNDFRPIAIEADVTSTVNYLASTGTEFRESGGKIRLGANPVNSQIVTLGGQDRRNAQANAAGAAGD
jgi:hypothetical protein